MTPVKINLFISCDRSDGHYLKTLLTWLYPMRDEVNLWYERPPDPPPELPLPWQLLLFWYSPPNSRREYYLRLQKQKERAHIYLFLTSYKSLNNNMIQADVSLAVNRRIATGDDLNPLIFPVLLSPSHWQEQSGLSGYKPLGAKKTLAETKPIEEGFLQLTDQLAKFVKVLQRRLTEEKFYQARLVTSDSNLATASDRAHPYLGDDDDATEMPEITSIELPEWLGWGIIALLIVLTYRGLQPPLPVTPKYYRSNTERQMEYRREYPLAPPEEPIVFPAE
jgi:hypothetical protein